MRTPFVRRGRIFAVFENKILEVTNLINICVLYNCQYLVSETHTNMKATGCERWGSGCDQAVECEREGAEEVCCGVQVDDGRLIFKYEKWMNSSARESTAAEWEAPPLPV